MVFGMSESLAEVIDHLWTTPENAGVDSRTSVVSLRAMFNDGWRVLTKSSAWGHNALKRPAFSHRARHFARLSMSDSRSDYYERCYRENPDGEWSSSRKKSGELVNLIASLWRDCVSASAGLARCGSAWKSAKGGDSEEICIVQATESITLEQEPIREQILLIG